VSLFAEIRAASAEVTRRALSVHIDADALERFAQALAAERPARPALDPAHQRLGAPPETLAFVVTLNALNFGSGWFPVLRKRAGLSGYLTVAGALREHFEARGPWSARELTAQSPESCARVFGQEGNAAAGELMAWFARALGDLGRFLEDGFGGRFEGPIEAAGGAAEALVRLLARMPLYRDVARYGELEVPFYKRAQITCADLALAFEGRGPGSFRDLAELTLFADNLVPHVLRMKGVLRYAPELAARIEREELLASGSPEEVEIRAVALHGVERLAAACAAQGFAILPAALDQLLWARGQAPEIKAVARHRTRCTFY
jgi:Potential Queuosine, Q, salvage protein family